VQRGQPVLPGSPLGFVGNTGDADRGPPHLHIGIGYSILLGSDAYGGTGSGFDAVNFLRTVYAQARG
jgi:murein DD-endopeptidase MepM/ murein hydrolase activator NlpD